MIESLARPLQVIVYEDRGWQNLLPLVYGRAVFQLRCGMKTLLDRILALTTRGTASAWCRSELSRIITEQTGLAVNQPATSETLLLSGRGIWRRIPAASVGFGSWVGVVGKDKSVACIYIDSSRSATPTPEELLGGFSHSAWIGSLPRRDVSDCVRLIDWPWELVLANEKMLVADWDSGERRRVSVPEGKVPPGVHLLNPEDIHIGDDCKIKPCVVIDAEDGPVWIGDKVTILPHTYIQGPVYIGDGCRLQAGTSIRAGSTIGPASKVGGEIEASIIQGHSNKQHNGFLGHSYIGSWVNLAADCINSDLKNTYGKVRVPINGTEVETSEMFVGMFVGDHSKAGINVSFPTGAVIGYSSCILSTRSPKFVPSFAWIDDSGSQVYDCSRGLSLARTVMGRRNQIMTSAEEEVFLNVRRVASMLERQPIERLS